MKNILSFLFGSITTALWFVELVFLIEGVKVLVLIAASILSLLALIYVIAKAEKEA